MEYTTKEIVKPDTKQVIGLKLKTKPNLVGEQDFREFLSKCTCNFNIVLSEINNTMTCKFYLEETGELFFHFEQPMKYSILSGYFKDEDMIFPIKE